MPLWHATLRCDTNKQGTRCNATALDVTEIQLYSMPSGCGKNVPLNDKSSAEKQVRPSQIRAIAEDNAPPLTYNFISKKLV